MIDHLITQIIEMQNPTAVGLDTDLNYLPDELKKEAYNFETAAKAIFEFNKNIIDAVCDIIPAVKLQIAYYEMYSYPGLKAFYDTLLYAKQKKLTVIVDAKRNDIDATASCYSKAFLGTTEINGNLLSAFPCDFLTVNAYLGSDGIKPFIENVKKHNKGIFILVKTSNPSSVELQDKQLSDGATIYEYMGDCVKTWGADDIGKYGYSNIGAVVGATQKIQAAILRKKLKHTFFLIPGYGAQGATAHDLRTCFDEQARGGIVNSSRGIICAYKTEKYKHYNYAQAARIACIDMKNDLNNVLKK